MSKSPTARTHFPSFSVGVRRCLRARSEEQSAGEVMIIAASNSNGVSKFIQFVARRTKIGCRSEHAHTARQHACQLIGMFDSQSQCRRQTPQYAQRCCALIAPKCLIPNIFEFSVNGLRVHGTRGMHYTRHPPMGWRMRWWVNRTERTSGSRCG